MLSTATTLTLANGAKTKLLLDISIGNMGFFVHGFREDTNSFPKAIRFLSNIETPRVE
jgi:hypothetical protein